jgi:hypothetical protein
MHLKKYHAIHPWRPCYELAHKSITIDNKVHGVNFGIDFTLILKELVNTQICLILLKITWYSFLKKEKSWGQPLKTLQLNTLESIPIY